MPNTHFPLLQVKDLVAVKPETTRYNDGPQTVKEVYANGTVKLRQTTPKGGAATQTWNKRNVKPYKD